MKRHFRPLVCLLLCVILLCSCGNTQPPSAQMSDDFSFVFVFDFIEVDTNNGTIKNTYYFEQGDPYAVADFTFTAEQMQTIYEAFVDYKVQKLPEVIDPNKSYMSIPPSHYELTYTADGQTGRVECSTGGHADDVGISKNNNRFVKFMTVVWDIVRASDALKEVPSGPYVE